MYRPGMKIDAAARTAVMKDRNEQGGPKLETAVGRHFLDSGQALTFPVILDLQIEVGKSAIFHVAVTGP